MSDSARDNAIEVFRRYHWNGVANHATQVVDAFLAAAVEAVRKDEEAFELHRSNDVASPGEKRMRVHEYVCALEVWKGEVARLRTALEWFAAYDSITIHRSQESMKRARAVLLGLDAETDADFVNRLWDERKDRPRD